MNSAPRHVVPPRPQSQRPQPGPAGFSLVELMVVLSIIATLAALLLPAVANVKQRARTVQCVGNLRQIGLALQMYVDDDPRGHLPPDPQGTNTAPWIDQLRPYIGTLDAVRTCPSDPLARVRRLWGRTGYVLNEYTASGGDYTPGFAPESSIVTPDGKSFLVNPSSQKASAYKNPAATFLVFEASNLGARLPEPNSAPGARPIFDDHTHPDTWHLGWPHVLADIDPHRHGPRANYLFADWHVATLGAEQLKQRIDRGDNIAVIPE